MGQPGGPPKEGAQEASLNIDRVADLFQSPHPTSNVKPQNLTEETHFGHLSLRVHFFSLYQKLTAIEEVWNEDRRVDRVVRLLAQHPHDHEGAIQYNAHITADVCPSDVLFSHYS